MKRLLMLATLALTASAEAQTLVPFSDAKVPFRFSYPKGWLGIYLDDGTNGVSMVSAKQPPATMMRLLFAPKGNQKLTMAQQLSGFEEGLKSTGVSLKRQSSYNATYGGLRGTEREYLVSKSGKSVKMRVWFGEGSKNIYSFQLTDTPQRYPAASKLFTSVLKTVKFK